MSGPEYRPEPQGPATADLFAAVDVVDEHSLGKRLVQHGIDLYIDGEFATYADRLRAVIVHARVASVIQGRDPGGKVEDYSQAFARVTSEPWVKKAPRGAKSNATSEST